MSSAAAVIVMVCGLLPAAEVAATADKVVAAVGGAAIARECGSDEASAAMMPVHGGGLPDPQRGMQACTSGDIDELSSRNAGGTLRSLSAGGGDLDRSNPFFQSLGSNGRSCATCHRLEAAWSLTPSGVQALFDASGGHDPLFRLNDGANSPLADVSTIQAQRAAYSMLLGKAVIRVGLPIPTTAEFALEHADDPYGFANASELSLFRRPLPATNLRFLTGVMWDDRETHASFAPPMDAGSAMNNLAASLRSQAINATLGHAQAAQAPAEQQVEQIVAFELGLSTAQVRSGSAGRLSDADAIGGPRVLADQQFHVGSNDALGADPVATPSGAVAMRLFDAWQTSTVAARNEIARGEQLFNSRRFAISGVSGLNDEANLRVIAGTCATCHDTPNVGNHSVSASMNIGTTDAGTRTPDMPLYTLRNKADGRYAQTTDPGRALATGKWADIGKFKNPVLRGLAGRAPYFHNGMAATLADVIDFYDSRFAIGLTQLERSDLAAFLNAL